jgi:hypothetical protein
MTFSDFVSWFGIAASIGWVLLVLRSHRQVMRLAPDSTLAQQVITTAEALRFGALSIGYFLLHLLPDLGLATVLLQLLAVLGGWMTFAQVRRRQRRAATVGGAPVASPPTATPH